MSPTRALVTPFACPTSAAIVLSVKPGPLAMPVKLWRSTCGVTSQNGDFSNSCSEWFGKPPKVLSSPCPGRTYEPVRLLRRASRNSTTGSPIGRTEPLSLLQRGADNARGVDLGPHQSDRFADSPSTRPDEWSRPWSRISHPLRPAAASHPRFDTPLR